MQNTLFALAVALCVATLSGGCTPQGPASIPTTKKTPSNGPPAPRNLKARIAYRDYQQVVLADVGPRGLRVVARHKLKLALDNMVWADHRTLLVQTDTQKSGSPQVVYMIRDLKLSRILLPSTLWKAAPPRETRGVTRYALPFKAQLIPTAKGEVWLSHCSWAIQGDCDPCQQWVYVRVWPRPRAGSLPEQLVTTPKHILTRRPPPHQPPRGSAAVGYRISFTAKATGDHMVCYSNGREGLRYDGGADTALALHWLGPHTRRFLLSFHSTNRLSEKMCPGPQRAETSPRGWELWRACDPKSRKNLEQASWGPDGFWAAEVENGLWAVFHLGKRLMTLPEKRVENVLFQPRRKPAASSARVCVGGGCG